METLASLFVTLVLVGNGLFPGSNLPQLLGVSLPLEERVLSEETSSEDSVGENKVEASAGDESLETNVSTNTDHLEVADKIKEARRAAIRERKEIAERIKNAREKLLEEREREREEFKERLQELRDERKKAVVENIDERIFNLNKKWVDHLNKVLDRLSEILAKIDARSGDTYVQAAVTAAEAAISSAQELVDAQAEKTYTADIGDENTLGEEVRTIINQFHTDIKAVREQVVKAREATKAALAALRSVSSEGGEND